MEYVTPLLVGIVGSLVAAELYARLPQVARLLIDYAIQKIPNGHRMRFKEEWLSHLEECQGNLEKLQHGYGCYVGAAAIALALHNVPQTKIGGSHEGFDSQPDEMNIALASNAVQSFGIARQLNHEVSYGGPNPAIGIITTRKCYANLREALRDLRLDEEKSNSFGLRVLNIGCSWSISRQDIAHFAIGLDLVIVIEEKRSSLEVQLRRQLYGTANQPVCIGKQDEYGNWLFARSDDLPDTCSIAICIGERILRYGPNDHIAKKVRDLRNSLSTSSKSKEISIPGVNEGIWPTQYKDFAENYPSAFAVVELIGKAGHHNAEHATGDRVNFALAKFAPEDIDIALQFLMEMHIKLRLAF